MAAAEERFDAILLELAGQCGGIQPLLQTFFSFLYRKTDFFHVMQPGDKIGFKAGQAQQILLRAFGKYEQLATSVAKQRAAEVQKSNVAAAAQKPAKPTAPPPAAAPAPPPPAKKEPAKGEAAGGKAAAAPTTAPVTAPVTASAGAVADRGAAAAAAAGAKSASHLAEQVGVPYNGGRTERYYWEQTLNDVTINVPVPQGTRARDVVCVISKTHLNLVILLSLSPSHSAAMPSMANVPWLIRVLPQSWLLFKLPGTRQQTLSDCEVR